MIRSDVYMMSVLAMIVILVVIVCLRNGSCSYLIRRLARARNVTQSNECHLYVRSSADDRDGDSGCRRHLDGCAAYHPCGQRQVLDRFVLLDDLPVCCFRRRQRRLSTIISAAWGGRTGPFIVVVAAVFFIFSLVFGLRKGWLIQLLEHRAKRKQVTYAHSSTSGRAVEGGS